MHPYDDWDRPLGYCNHCGEEALLNSECCIDGEVVPFDDADYRDGDL